MKDMLSIGKLANLTNTTIETLRHYDKKGILKPSFVDTETNYRYYSILQTHQLTLILELREIGMSIDDIKIYMDNQNTKTSLIVFNEKLENVRNLIKKMKK